METFTARMLEANDTTIKFDGQNATFTICGEKPKTAKIVTISTQLKKSGELKISRTFEEDYLTVDGEENVTAILNIITDAFTQYMETLKTVGSVFDQDGGTQFAVVTKANKNIGVSRGDIVRISPNAGNTRVSKWATGRKMKGGAAQVHDGNSNLVSIMTGRGEFHTIVMADEEAAKGFVDAVNSVV